MSSCARNRSRIVKKSRSDNSDTQPSVATNRQSNRRSSMSRAFNPQRDGRYAMCAAFRNRDTAALLAAVELTRAVPQVAWRTFTHIVCLMVHRREAISALTFLIAQQTRQSIDDAQSVLLASVAGFTQLTQSTMSYEYFSSATLCPPVRPLDGTHTPGGIVGIEFSDARSDCPYDVLKAFEAIHTELRVHQNVRGGLQAAFAVLWADHHYKVSARRSSLGNDPKGRAFGMSIRRALGLAEFSWSTVMRAELAVYAQLGAIAQAFVPARADVVELCRIAFDMVNNQRIFNSYSLVTAIIMALMFSDTPADAPQPENSSQQPLMQSVPIGSKASPAMSPEDWVLADQCVVDRNGYTARTLLDRAQTAYTGCLAKLEDRMQHVLTPAWETHFARIDASTAPLDSQPDECSAHGSDEF